jgi:hypothetical protein
LNVQNNVVLTDGTCARWITGSGIFEDVDYGRPATSHGVLNYTASATNALWAAKLLEKHQRGEDTAWIGGGLR